MPATDLPAWLYREPPRTYPTVARLAGTMERCPQPSPRVLAELRHERKRRRWWPWVLLGVLL